MNGFLHRAHVSSYYPPRARWYTRLFFVPGERIRRQLFQNRFRPSAKIAFARLLGSLVIPGFAFFVLNRLWLGTVFLFGYLLAVLVFIVALGYPAANIAFGLMISLHATSVVFLEGLWLARERLRLRLAAAFCTLIALWALVYAPILHFMERHWLVPLRMGNRVLIISRRIAPAQIRRGDWVAYELSERRAADAQSGRMIVQSGLGIGRVLSLPGDQVRFERGVLFVNDRPEPAAGHMPTAGEMIVPEKVWFIWPGFDISGHGAIAESDISATLERLALVPRNEIIGRPFKHWFGRHQSL